MTQMPMMSRSFASVRPCLAAILTLGFIVLTEVPASPAVALEPQLVLEKVTISLAPAFAFAPVFVALDKGYFRDEGIGAEIVSTPLATDSVTMTANGQTDIGATATGVSLFNAGYRGLDFKIVASMAVHPAPTTIIPLMIRKDLWDSGAIKSAKDLKGKAISTNSPGGSIEYKLALILEKYGMTIKDVREISIGLPETLVALDNKAVDAAILGEPFATEAARRGLAVIDVADSGAAVGDLGSAIVFNKAFMTKRHDVAVRALRAMARAARDLQPDNWKTPENIAIFVKRFKFPKETIEAIAFPRFDPNLDIAKFLPSLEHQAKVHVGDKRMIQAAADAVPSTIDGSFVTEAAAKK